MSQVNINLIEIQNCLNKIREIHSKILISPGTHPEYKAELNKNMEQFRNLSILLNGIDQSRF